jgi:hypothetical protein
MRYAHQRLSAAQAPIRQSVRTAHPTVGRVPGSCVECEVVYSRKQAAGVPYEVTELAKQPEILSMRHRATAVG